jgi:hypothetical protein
MTDHLNSLVERLRLPDWLKTLADHNRGLFVALILAAVVACPLACDVTTKSPFTGQTVTREQLAVEVQLQAKDIERRLVALQGASEDVKIKADAAYAEIERKQAKITAALNIITSLTSQFAPGIPVGGIASVVLGLTSGGLFLDNRRKDMIVETEKAKSATPTNPIL